MRSWVDCAVSMMSDHGWRLTGKRYGYGLEEFLFVNWNGARKTLVRDALYDIWIHYVNRDENK